MGFHEIARSSKSQVREGRLIMIRAKWSLSSLLVRTVLLPGILSVSSSKATPESLPEQKLIIGTEQAYPPYSFVDENNNPTGFNVDLSFAVSTVLNRSVKIRIAPWNAIRSALEKEQIEMIAGMYDSPGRAREADFTAPIALVQQTAFVRSNGPEIKSKDDLIGKQIIVMRGDIMHDYIQEHGITDSPVLVDTLPTALRLLASGEHDCVLAARLPGLYWIRKFQLSNVVESGPPLLQSRYCFAVKKGKTELLQSLNEALAIVAEAGIKRDLANRWFGTLEPAGIPLEKALHYFSYALLPFLLLILFVMLWSWMLRRQVERRTRELWENEKHLADINSILASIRRIERLITREKNPDKLLRETCKLLLESKGFNRVCIIPSDPTGAPQTPLYAAGPGNQLADPSRLTPALYRHHTYRNPPRSFNRTGKGLRWLPHVRKLSRPTGTDHPTTA
jgi:ABC-type amino acid transport substrate-binding protein